MEHWLDRTARRLAQERTRRGLLKQLGLGLVGWLFAPLFTRGAQAQVGPQQGSAPCTPGQVACNGQCWWSTDTTNPCLNATAPRGSPPVSATPPAAPTPAPLGPIVNGSPLASPAPIVNGSPLLSPTPIVNGSPLPSPAPIVNGSPLSSPAPSPTALACDSDTCMPPNCCCLFENTTSCVPLAICVAAGGACA